MAYTSGSPGAGQLEIGIALVLQDRFSNQAREASSQIRKLHMDAKNAINANLQAIQGIASQGMNIAAGLGSNFIGAINEGADFLDMMVTVEAITNASQKEMDSLTDFAQTLGMKTMFNSQEIAGGMKYLAMAGTEAKDMAEMVKGAAMVANATGNILEGKGGTADLLTNIMRTFRIEASEAASVVGDQLTKATLSSNMSLTDLAESIKYAGSTAVTMNQSLPSTIALIGTLSNAGIQASMAGTNLENAFRYLGKSILEPNFRGGKALAKLGLSREDFLDAQGNIIDMGMAMGKLNEASKHLQSAERTNLYQQIFGVRGFRAAMVIGRNIDNYQDLLQKIQNSSGTAEKVVGMRMESLAGSIDAMLNAFENVRTTFTKSIAPVITPILKTIGHIGEAIRAILDIPVLGTLISTTTAVSIGLLGITSAIVFLRTKWLLFRNDSQVTSKSWFALLKSGWDVATIRADRYLQIQTAIVAQQKGGMMFNPAMYAMDQNPNTWVGNARKSVSSSGRVSYWVKDEKGGIKRTTADKAAGVAGPAGATTAILNNDPLKQKGVTKNGKNVVGTGSLANSMGGLAKVGRGLLGFLGGPIGVAITAGAFLLPMAVNGITNLINKNKENTDATENLTNKINEDIVSRAASEQNKAQTKITEEIRGLATVLEFWGRKIVEGKQQDLYAQLNIDGKQLGETMKGYISNSQDTDNFNNNTK